MNEIDEASTYVSPKEEKPYHCKRCVLGFDDLHGLQTHYSELHFKNYVDPYIPSEHANVNQQAPNEHQEKQHRVEEEEKASLKIDLKETKKPETQPSETLNRRKSTRVSSKRKLSIETTQSEESIEILSKKTLLKTNELITSVGAKQVKTPRASLSSSNMSATNKEAQDAPFDEYKNNLDKKKIKDMDLDDLEKYNLADIDETPYVAMSKKCTQPKRMRDIVAGRVAWAKWKHTMWPAMIERVTKDPKKNCLKIGFRYYEQTRRLGNVFTLDSSKIELFFKCENHVDYKRLACVNQNQRIEFFIGYTNALKDYVKFNSEQDLREHNSVNNDTFNNATSDDVDMEEQDDEDSYVNRSRGRVKTATSKSYNILGKMWTLDAIKDYARKFYSTEQQHENEVRRENSIRLLEIVKSEECKEFLLSVFSAQSKNERHLAYMRANSRQRRTSPFKNDYVGPLLNEDQISIACYLKKLSDENFKDKPENLASYEHDVLYPEAVIWSIQELYELTYKKAEAKFKTGFPQSNEEITKRKCVEILNKLNIKIDENKELQVKNQEEISEEDDDVDEYQEHDNTEDASFFLYENNHELPNIQVATAEQNEQMIVEPHEQQEQDDSQELKNTNNNNCDIITLENDKKIEENKESGEQQLDLHELKDNETSECLNSKTLENDDQIKEKKEIHEEKHQQQYESHDLNSNNSNSSDIIALENENQIEEMNANYMNYKMTKNEKLSSEAERVLNENKGITESSQDGDDDVVSIQSSNVTQSVINDENKQEPSETSIISISSSDSDSKMDDTCQQDSQVASLENQLKSELNQIVTENQETKEVEKIPTNDELSSDS